MVYLEPVHLGWKPLVQSWAENFKKKFPAHSESLKKWVIDICDKALPFLREECLEAPGIPSVDTNLVASFLRMLTTFISPQHGFKLEEGGKGTENKQEKVLARIYCAFSAIWSLGANLHEDSRKKFQNFLKNLLQTFCPEVGDEDLYTLCVNDEEAGMQVLGISWHFSPTTLAMVKTNKGEPSIFTNLRRFVAGGSAWGLVNKNPEGSASGIVEILKAAGFQWGQAAQFVDSFLRALQDNRGNQKEKCSLCGPNGKGIWEDPWEDLPALRDSLKHFSKVVHRLDPRELSDLLCDTWRMIWTELSLVIWQLRAWFTLGSASLVLEILDRIADMPNRLPSTMDGGDPGLAALRLIEGYIFFCVAHQESLKSEIAHVLVRILRKKRLPPCTSVRIEAALASLKCGIEVPETRLQELNGEEFLDSLAIALAPDFYCTRRMEQARNRLARAVNQAVEDVDVVVVLPEHHELRNSSKQAAATCVELMGKTLVDNEEEWGIYVLDLVTNARVPVLKCRSLELVDIDITFNNLLPLYNSRLLKSYSLLDDRVANEVESYPFFKKNITMSRRCLMGFTTFGF
eukprot:symbB.v1.2.009283.t3/scaffold571.1/size186967/1